jgi:hypothetical protein
MKKLLPFLLLLISCKAGGKNDSRDPADTVTPNATASGMADSKDSIDRLPYDELTEGVIDLKENARGLVRLYDLNGAVWKTIDLANDSAQVTFIKPYSMKLENTHLVFRCVGERGDFYTVIANEDSGFLKCISKQDTGWVFQPWDKHVLSVFSVDFDAERNPIRKSPDSTAATEKYVKEEIYRPIEIRSDWLKVKWGDVSTADSGWVRWKTGDKCLLGLFYSE